MDRIVQVIGLLLFVGLPVAIVVWLARASRRPACPDCRYSVSPDDVVCRKCGCSLVSPDKPDGGSVTRRKVEAED